MTDSVWNSEPETDTEAIKFLEDAGYRCLRGFTWNLPAADHEPTKDELIAVRYLFLEWDWGGIEDSWVDPSEVPRISKVGNV